MNFFRIFSILFFSSFGLIANAFEGFDECTVFKELAQKEIPKLDFEMPWQTEESFGLTFDYYADDDGDSKLLYVDVDKIYPQTREYYEDYDWQIVLSGIYKLNGFDVNEMTEDQFLEEIEKNTIKLEFFGHGADEYYSFSKKEHQVLDVAINPDIYQIYDIDPKSENFGTKLQLEYWFLDNRFFEIMRQVHEQALGIDPDAYDNLKEGETIGFYCDVSVDFFKSLGITVPELELVGFKTDIDVEEPKYRISYVADSSEINLHEEPRSYEDKMDLFLEGQAEFAMVNVKRSFQGIVLNNYDFRKFPFDRQKIEFNFRQKTSNWEFYDGAIRYDLGWAGQDNLDTTFELAENSEWNFTDYNWRTIHAYDNLTREYAPLLGIYFDIKRNFEYYLFKLFLPILLLLSLTWSIFWINPTDLETKITISIVTFLALIAYNFVIDNDLAKLAYLTFLDAVILVSYFFAGLPTFFAIFCKNLIQSDRESIGLKINSACKIAFPVMYMVSLGFVIIYFEILSDI